MKKSELQELIREAIDEILNEETIDVSNPGSLTGPQKQALIQKARNTTKNPKLGTADNPVDFVEEKKLKEMARQSIVYKLTDDYADKLSELPYVGSDKRMKWVNGIIDYVQENGPSDITTIAREKFNVPQPRISDYARDMIRLGILAPTVEGTVPQFMRPEPETGEGAGTEEDELAQMGIVGGDLSDEEIEASFTQAKSAGDTEFDDKITQRVGGEEVPSATSLSDEDYEAFMKYSELADRLAKVKSDLQRMKRSRGMGTAGDISDKPSTEEKRLRDLKASLEQRVAALVADSEYLQARQAKRDELDEWSKKKLQYYAGIIK